VLIAIGFPTHLLLSSADDQQVENNRYVKRLWSKQTGVSVMLMPRSASVPKSQVRYRSRITPNMEIGRAGLHHA
jgi:hypothetical protein